MRGSPLLLATVVLVAGLTGACVDLSRPATVNTCGASGCQDAAVPGGRGSDAADAASQVPDARTGLDGPAADLDGPGPNLDGPGSNLDAPGAPLDGPGGGPQDAATLADAEAPVPKADVHVDSCNATEPPAGLVAARGDGKVTLTWTASAGATTYTVKRSTTAGTGHFTVASGLTTTTWSDGALVNGTTYHYVVTAGGPCGDSAPSMEASARPVAKTALFVVGALTLNGGDQIVRDRIEAQGLSVVLVSDRNVSAANATDKMLVVISESVGSTVVGATFRDVATPVLLLEGHVVDLMGMTGTVVGTDLGDEPAQTSVEVTQPAHPLAAGLSGTVRVTNIATEFAWGKPGPSAHKIATLPSNAARAVIFGYDAGAPMVGLTAIERRTFFFSPNITADDLNASGQKLLDAAIVWTAGL